MGAFFGGKSKSGFPNPKTNFAFFEQIKKRTMNHKIHTLTKRTKKKSNPGPLTWKVHALSIAPRQLILKYSVKLITFNTFAHEILSVDAV